LPIAVIFSGKLQPGDPRRQQALDCGFREQTVYTRPEDPGATRELCERELFAHSPNQFFVYEGAMGLVSVVLSASEKCQHGLFARGFEAGEALIKWWGVEQLPDPIKSVAVVTDYWGRSNDD
jgi:hypothetical protein